MNKDPRDTLKSDDQTVDTPHRRAKAIEGVPFDDGRGGSAVFRDGLFWCRCGPLPAAMRHRHQWVEAPSGALTCAVKGCGLMTETPLLARPRRQPAVRLVVAESSLAEAHRALTALVRQALQRHGIR